MLQDLPELVLDLLCELLSYEDVLALRSTCKGLKWFVDGKQFTKLNLFVRKYSCHQRLFYTGDWVGYPHSLHSDDLAILTADRFKGQFAGVQRMIICYKRRNRLYERASTQFDLSILNCFSALSHLEIHELPLKGKLNLPELRIAAFKSNTGDPPFELNCPKLRALKIRWCKPILTSCTDQLDYLHYCDTDRKEISWLRITSPNLQRLSTLCLEAISYFYSDGLLRILSDLSTDRLSLPSLDRIRLERAESFEDLDEMVSRLDASKENDRTKRIQFTFLGRPIDSPDELRRIVNQINACNSETYDPLTVHPKGVRDGALRFLNEEPELGFLLAVIPDLSLSEESTVLSEQMVKKLKGIKVLRFGGALQLTESMLELFSSTCKSLRELYLWSRVTERMPRIMSNHLVNLDELVIHSCRFDTLKPLVEFRNLCRLSVHYLPSQDELTFICENSRTLECVSIGSSDPISLYVERDRTGLHQIRRPSERTDLSNAEFDNLHDMIRQFYENYVPKKKPRDSEIIGW